MQDQFPFSRNYFKTGISLPTSSSSTFFRKSAIVSFDRESNLLYSSCSSCSSLLACTRVLSQTSLPPILTLHSAVRPPSLQFSPCTQQSDLPPSNSHSALARVQDDNFTFDKPSIIPIYIHIETKSTFTKFVTAFNSFSFSTEASRRSSNSVCTPSYLL